MDRLVVLTFLLMILLNSLQSSNGEKYSFYLTHLNVGESCALNKNRANGTCVAKSDCVGYSPSNLAICSWDYTSDPVICCPEHTNKRQAQLNTFQDFNEKCTVSLKGVEGRLINKNYCYSNETFPEACPYEICSDLICCPYQNYKRLARGK